MPLPRLAVLVSGSGTNLQALLDRGPDLGGEITLVVSDRAGAGGLRRADDAGFKTAVVPPADFPDRAHWAARSGRRRGAGHASLSAR